MNNNELFFKQRAEIFHWGPVPGRYFFNSSIVEEIFKFFSDRYKEYHWPKSLFLFKDKKMVWLNDFEELREAGKKAFTKFILPKEADLEGLL